MTLVTVLQGRNFLVSASDSRGTFGHPQVAFSAHDMMKKMNKVSPHVVILNYGAGEIADNLVDDFKRTLDPTKDGITTILSDFQTHCLTKWNTYFQHIPFQFRPSIAYLVAGLDKEEESYRIPRIYSLSSRVGFAPALHSYGWANGGIPIYAIYIYGRRYRPEMNINDLCGLAAFAISETATQDQRVGGPIKMMKILPTAIEEMTEQQVNTALQRYVEGSGGRE